MPQARGGGPPKKPKAIQVPMPAPRAPRTVYSPPATYKATRNATRMINKAVGFKALAPSRSPRGASVRIAPAGTVGQVSRQYNKTPGASGGGASGFSTQGSFGIKSAPAIRVMSNTQKNMAGWYGPPDPKRRGKASVKPLKQIVVGNQKKGRAYIGKKQDKGQTAPISETRLIAHELGHTLGLVHPPTSTRPAKFTRSGGVMGSGSGYTKVQKNVLKQRLAPKRRKYGGYV